MAGFGRHQRHSVAAGHAVMVCGLCGVLAVAGLSLGLMTVLLMRFLFWVIG